MKKIIVTNNEKVVNEFKGNEDVRIEFVEGSPLQVFDRAEDLVEEGGRVFSDPKRTPLNLYYRSIPLSIDPEVTPNYSKNVLELCRIKIGEKSFSKPAGSGKAEKDYKNLMKVI